MFRSAGNGSKFRLFSIQTNLQSFDNDRIDYREWLILEENYRINDPPKSTVPRNAKMKKVFVLKIVGKFKVRIKHACNAPTVLKPTTHYVNDTTQCHLHHAFTPTNEWSYLRMRVWSYPVSDAV